jgi:hypothetical protein
MDEKRKGEIALLCLKYRTEKEGVRLALDKMRDFGNIAKEIGVPFDELKEFMRMVIQELVDKMFAPKSSVKQHG